jgi:hypothetical protein
LLPEKTCFVTISVCEATPASTMNSQCSDDAMDVASQSSQSSTPNSRQSDDSDKKSNGSVFFSTNQIFSFIFFDYYQGDQIGLIFAYFSTVYFGQFFFRKNTEGALIFGLLFSIVKMLKKGSGYAFGDIYHELIWSP